MGNSPLHFACMLEKSKHAELLLEYGAVPNVRNEHGQSPLDLLPRDAVRSTKLHFKRIFEVHLGCVRLDYFISSESHFEFIDFCRMRSPSMLQPL